MARYRLEELVQSVVSLVYLLHLASSQCYDKRGLMGSDPLIDCGTSTSLIYDDP